MPLSVSHGVGAASSVICSPNGYPSPMVIDPKIGGGPPRRTVENVETLAIDGSVTGIITVFRNRIHGLTHGHGRLKALVVQHVRRLKAPDAKVEVR